MVLSVQQFEQPITEARRKLNANTGAAGQVVQELTTASDALTSAGNAHNTDAQALRGDWRGAEGRLFGDKAKPVTTALDGAAEWAQTTAQKITDATSAIRSAQQEVDALIKEFEADAQGVVDAFNAMSPEDQQKNQAQVTAILHAMASKYAAEAARVLNAAKGKLTSLGDDAPAVLTSPQSGGDIGSRDVGGGSGGGTHHYGGGGHHYGGDGGGGTAGTIAPHGGVTAKNAVKEDDLAGTNKIRLPDGTIIEAQSPQAAAAVRAELSQLGLPYQWGGNSPATGMDCSGFTKWAYAQAGIDLPRTSGQQTVGMHFTDPGQLQPGDLVVWNGHVAMYAGNGQICEEPQTGDVAHMRPLYTKNGSDAFLGFYRPTAR